MTDPDDFYERTGIRLENPDALDAGHISQSVYKQWRSPKSGSANPERMTNPLWTWLVRTGASAYQATQKFGGPESFQAGPAWCFDRLGQGLIVLSDGTRVFIAGEHEDFYDPDFQIYNDVILWKPSGEIEILGYPSDVFPPTDFHTATLLGDSIILVGNLGYPETRRSDDTQVARLNTKSWSIELLATTGEKPAWLHNHKAALIESEGVIRVRGGYVGIGTEQSPLRENLDVWELDTATWRWSQSWSCPWPRFRIARTDGENLDLWSMEQALRPDETTSFALDSSASDLDPTIIDSIRQYARQRQEESARLIQRGVTHDLLASLYSPPIDHTEVDESEDFGDEYPFKVKRRRVNGVIVRYVDEMYFLQVMVEGELPAEFVERLIEDVRCKLETIQGAACVALES